MARIPVMGISLLGAVGLLGCASAQSNREGGPPPEPYARALVALETGDHETGRAELIRLLEYCGTSPLGERVAIALMTDALDPRRPDADFSAGLSHAYLIQPYRTDWAERIATSVYLVSLNLGGSHEGQPSILRSAAPEEFPNECGRTPALPAWREPQAIPSLSEQSIAARVGEMEISIEELQAELNRVRETLRP